MIPLRITNSQHFYLFIYFLLVVRTIKYLTGKELRKLSHDNNSQDFLPWSKFVTLIKRFSVREKGVMGAKELIVPAQLEADSTKSNLRLQRANKLFFLRAALEYHKWVFPIRLQSCIQTGPRKL